MLLLEIIVCLALTAEGAASSQIVLVTLTFCPQSHPSNHLSEKARPES